jgi:hypothetical protein
MLGALLAALAAGCGGGGSGPKPLEKADYVKQMQTIGRNLSTSLNALGGSATSAPKTAVALTKVQTDLRAAADKMDAITPPTDVAAQHAKLAKAVREFADELTPLIKKAKAGDKTTLNSLRGLKGIADIGAASGAIANKGYKIGG